jgi:hypothetical protein
MAHKLETSHISFGLVTIPVGIYSAIEEQDIHFNQLHGVCGSRIKQRRFCPTCNRDVEYDELVKGYEIAKDQYVQLMPSELEQLQAAESDAMQIVEFVPLTAIDPIYFENTFHLGAEKQGEKAGPGATVRAYKEGDFKGPEIVFASGQRIPKLSKRDMSNEIESMKIACDISPRATTSGIAPTP